MAFDITQYLKSHTDTLEIRITPGHFNHSYLFAINVKQSPVYIWQRAVIKANTPK